MKTDLFNNNKVEKRPVVWDKASSKYSNRTLKRTAREQLILVLSDIENTDNKTF